MDWLFAAHILTAVTPLRMQQRDVLDFPPKSVLPLIFNKSSPPFFLSLQPPERLPPSTRGPR
jgi:hypothetical protein